MAKYMADIERIGAPTVHRLDDSAIGVRLSGPKGFSLYAKAYSPQGGEAYSVQVQGQEVLSLIRQPDGTLQRELVAAPTLHTSPGAEYGPTLTLTLSRSDAGRMVQWLEDAVDGSEDAIGQLLLDALADAVSAPPPPSGGSDTEHEPLRNA